MMTSAELAADMEIVLRVCPPYVSPGTTSWTSIMSGAGCDCSGVPCVIFNRHGLELYHGSNTIARKYADGLEKLTSVNQLCVGMAVYKWSPSGSEPEKYRADGMGDFHHIGVVTSVSPLRIVHQSSAAGHTACDTSIKKWAYCSQLKGVQYDLNQKVNPISTEEGTKMYKVKVTVKSLRIRAEASTNSAVLGSLPRGTEVECSALVGGWYKLADTDGWISAEYCIVLNEPSYYEDEPADDPVEPVRDWAQEIAELRQMILTNAAAIGELSRKINLTEGDDE